MSLPDPVTLELNKTLKVLSFNVWGLKYISKDRKIRIQAIAHYLSGKSYDIVCLQELWVYDDFVIVRDQVGGVLPFSRFFHTGALGSGLAIFSRYPIISAHALPYSLSGSPQQAFAGDFFVKKAAANVVLLHPVLGEIEVWNTHMHAAGEHPPDTRQAHRIAESWQLANAIRGAAAKGRYVLCMGDLNSQPFSIPIAILRNHASLTDSFLSVHPDANIASSSSPHQAISSLGMTCDSPLNTYSHGKPIPSNITSQGGKRLDYIFFRQPEVARRRPLIWGYRDHPVSDNGHGDSGSMGLEPGKPLQESVERAPELRCIKSEVVLTDMVPGYDFSYSDHFALFSTFSVDSPEKNQNSQPILEPTSSIHTTTTGIIGQSYGTTTSFTPLIPLISDSEPVNDTTTTFSPPSPPIPAIPTKRTSTDSVKSSTIQTALNTMRMYTSISRQSAKFQTRLCGVALVTLVGLTIGSAWQPKSWLQPIFTLLGGLLGAAVVTFLYTGWVWGRWEEGLLKEVTEEMELELRVVEMEERAGR
ncbi:inositol phosphorylsphingolipid-phospholipase C [Tremella mesenterica]|uniref:Inositol phosphorylsphingolipid-phospholipase C n=1 Tax=Tremella mesenterica TaxID=5217 RepID=A0A4Q1BT66_TREME|nr:uncharacterized protein TREMEDRAFT_31031 [Tremella mesenterica DSM 1558]EIW68860.1 hypothetical protein TREMEDRAFT_31031 [Tremella mesenterica DSM 1558]RXK41254.1 inositol phosphorylsphingolipid-phospholipase C [Tremella mesenterica]